MRLLGFCVMPNHEHLVLWPREVHGNRSDYTAGVCHSSRAGGGMEGIAAERPGWHFLRRNGLVAGHGEASGLESTLRPPGRPKRLRPDR